MPPFFMIGSIMEKKYVDNHTIFLSIHGSNAYGMANENSDIDLKGLIIPSKEYFFGFSKSFEQYQGDYPLSSDHLVKLSRITNREIRSDEKMDCCVYDLRKFFHLASKCNPNIIEILFLDEKFWLKETKYFKKIHDNRQLFLSTKANFSFRGYAFSQLKRIRTHRRWLLNPLERKPLRSDFGLIERKLIPSDQMLAAESLIKKRVDDWIFGQEEMSLELLTKVKDRTVETFSEIFSAFGAGNIINEDGFNINKLSNAAGKLLGYEENFLELLDKERKYKTALRDYNAYQNWKLNRSEVRAEAEKKYGFDLKHAAHLVRLLRMSKEILVSGEVNVYRDDAEELLDIRRGKYGYEELVDWAGKQDEIIQKIYNEKKSPLPREPNINKLNELCVEIIEEYLGTNDV